MASLVSPSALRCASALLGVLAIAAGCAQEQTDEPAGRAAERPREAAADPAEGAATPEPDAKYDSRCNYILGDFTESASGYRFVADAQIRNTGNIGIIARATAIWDQIGTDAVKATKTIRVPTGKTRKVQFTVVAAQSQIDLHQSAEAECRVRVSIVDTFGEAR